MNTSSAAPNFRTKASHRDSTQISATHSPSQLGEFILPPLSIEGLPLSEALNKVLAAYQDACRISGETPLALRFAVPPNASRHLNLHLQSKSFTTSVRLLATLAGMSITRNGLEYQFEPIPDDRRSGMNVVKVPPDFRTALEGMIGAESNRDPFLNATPPNHRTITESLAALGLELNPATRVSLSSSGELTLEGASPAEAATIQSLAELLTSQPPVQLKVATTVVDLNATMDWSPPDVSQLSDAQMQQLMRELAQKTGAELKTLPSVATHNGQAGTVEMIREVIYPTTDAGDQFETRNVGQVLTFQGSQLGFGQKLKFTYSDTTWEGYDPANSKIPIFDERVNVTNEGFSSDGSTRFSVQTRADGSQTLVLMTTQQINAAGLPIR
jgi:hypothetical protein